MKQLMDGVWHLRSITYDDTLLQNYTSDILTEEFHIEISALKAETSGDSGWKITDYQVEANNKARASSSAAWHIDNLGAGGIINERNHRNYMIIAPLCQKPFKDKGTLIRDGMGFIIDAPPWNMYLIRWNISHKGARPYFGPRMIKRHYLWIDDRSFDNNYTEEYVEPLYDN